MSCHHRQPETDKAPTGLNFWEHLLTWYGSYGLNYDGRYHHSAGSRTTECDIMSHMLTLLLPATCPGAAHVAIPSCRPGPFQSVQPQCRGPDHLSGSQATVPGPLRNVPQRPGCAPGTQP